MPPCGCIDRDAVEYEGLSLSARSHNMHGQTALTSTRHAKDQMLVKYPKNPPTFRIVCRNSVTYQLSAWPIACATPSPATPVPCDAAANASPANSVSPVVVAPPHKLMLILSNPVSRATCRGTVLKANVSARCMTRIGRVSSSSGEDGKRESPEAAETVALTFCANVSAGVLDIADGSTTPDMMGGNGSSIRVRYRQSGIRGRCNGVAPTPHSISAGKRWMSTQ